MPKSSKTPNLQGLLTFPFFQRSQPKLGARMKKLALPLNFTHIRQTPTNLTDFEKGRRPQEPNKNDVPPKPQQSNTTPRVTNNECRLRVCCFSSPKKESPQHPPLNASSPLRAGSPHTPRCTVRLNTTLGAALVVQTYRIWAPTVGERASRMAWLTVALGKL